LDAEAKSTVPETPLSVIQFWRDDVRPDRWFYYDAALDTAIRERFEPLWRSALDGALDHWPESPEGALALVLVLDQFPRNMFRERPESFTGDELARGVARQAIDRGFDMRVPSSLREFFYMPFMHSEDLADQDRCIALFEKGLGPGSPNLSYARHHRRLIARFGRFPWRNAILDRRNTPEEAAALASSPPR
jgi:uncharacterized protein (DUF924 family)